MLGHKSAAEFWAAQGERSQKDAEVFLAADYEALQAEISALSIYRPRLSALLSLTKKEN